MQCLFFWHLYTDFLIFTWFCISHSIFKNTNTCFTHIYTRKWKQVPLSVTCLLYRSKINLNSIFKNMKFSFRNRVGLLYHMLQEPVSNIPTLNEQQTSHFQGADNSQAEHLPIELYSLSFSRTADGLSPWEGRAFTYSLFTFRKDKCLLISSLVLFNLSSIFIKKDTISKKSSGKHQLWRPFNGARKVVCS